MCEEGVQIAREHLHTSGPVRSMDTQYLLLTSDYRVVAVKRNQYYHRILTKTQTVSVCVRMPASGYREIEAASSNDRHESVPKEDLQ